MAKYAMPISLFLRNKEGAAKPKSTKAKKAAKATKKFVPGSNPEAAAQP